MEGSPANRNSYGELMSSKDGHHSVFLQDRPVTATVRVSFLLANSVHPHCEAIWESLPPYGASAGLSIGEITGRIATSGKHAERYTAEILCRLMRTGWVRASDDAPRRFSKCSTSGAALKSKVRFTQRQMYFIPRSGQLSNKPFPAITGKRFSQWQLVTLPDEDQIYSQESLRGSISAQCQKEPKWFVPGKPDDEEGMALELLVRCHLIAKKAKILGCEVLGDIGVSEAKIVHECEITMDRSGGICSSRVFTVQQGNLGRIRPSHVYANYVSRATQTVEGFSERLLQAPGRLSFATSADTL